MLALCVHMHLNFVVCESVNVYHGLFACMSQFTLPR